MICQSSVQSIRNICVAMKYRTVNAREIFSCMRFDGSFHNAEANIYDSVIKNHSQNVLSFYCTEIFTSGRNKRTYTTKEHGYPFLSNSDVASANPLLTGKYSSKTYGYDEKALLKKGMILTGRVGAIGQTAIVPAFIEHANAAGSDNIIRIEVAPSYKNGFIYAYLASKIGTLLLLKHATGGVQPFITDAMVGQIPVPDFPVSFQSKVDSLIQSALSLRDESYILLANAERNLKEAAGLKDLAVEEYDYFGPRSYKRTVSCYTRNIRQIGTTSINAFNNSERIRKVQQRLLANSKPIKDLIEGGQTFSSGSLPSIEVKPGHGIMLINQKDIFDNIVVGKYISSKNANLNDLVQYGEILIACDGTLGENELFCRAIFANEDLAGSFISSHFMRMRANGVVPVGYLFAWLNSDYGFRLIRNTQAGTKICHPIQRMFQNIPVPIIDKEKMGDIDTMVRTAFTKRHQANNLEKEAISMVETEIDKWNKN